MGLHAQELSLLLNTSRTTPAEQAEHLLLTIKDDFDWTFLVETAYNHGVTGLLCNSLVKMPKTLIPDEIFSAAQQHLAQQRQANQTLADQLTDILTALDAAGIDAIPFKGPTLSMAAYGDLSLRTFRDLDFLIHYDKIQSCLEQLETIGYRQNVHLSPRQMHAFLDYSGQDILYGKGIPIEPHWGFAPRTLSLEIDYDGIWSRAGRRPFNGQAVRCFSPEDELIILCIHGCKEKWTKLKWVADISEFIRSHPQLDWYRLHLDAESQGLARMVRLGFSLAKHLLDAPLPPTATQWMDRDPFILTWSKQLTREFFNVEQRAQSIYEVSRYHWDMRERRRDRWHYLYRTLTQPREQHFMDIAIPDRLFFLYTPYKLLHDYLALPIWRRIKRSQQTNAAVSSTSEGKRTDAAR